MRVLGLSFSGHGSAVALVEDGRLLGAVNLERLSRVKFAVATLPAERDVLAATLRAFGAEVAPPIDDFYAVFPRMLEYLTGETDLPKAGIDLVVKTADNIRPSPLAQAPYEEFLAHFGKTRTHFGLEHHLCHAYQAYLSSPFDDAAILTIDGTGETLDRLGGESLSNTLCLGEGSRVRVLEECPFPSSVGGLYTTATRYLGFREEQEGNTMALAAFGSDRFLRKIEPDSVAFFDGGRWGFRANVMDQLGALCPRRTRDEPLTDDHKDLAFAVQALTEKIVVHLARGLAERTGKTRLAMAGGVALNCVANSKILGETPIERLYVMPNAGDRGLSVGAALYGYHVVLRGRERHPVAHDYLGRAYRDAEILTALRQAPNTECRRSEDIAGESAALLAKGRIIGWVQGGAEFGPRALGHRSIIADPRTVKSKERLDSEIKRREWFRPYAPSVLAEEADVYFEMRGPSPYMLLAVNVRPTMRSKVPGIVHVDGSARVQTVERDAEPLYHRLISKFRDLTGIPLVLNTSFNGYGEPMVETPDDALRSLHTMGLDALAVGDYLAWRAGSPP